jgi:hypothetical protein
VTFNTPEVHELATVGEFYPIGGTRETVGGRKHTEVGLAYSIKLGVIVASSQEEADIIAKELTLKEKPYLALV